MQMRRGVGYCRDARCEEYARGVFLLNHDGDFDCPGCGARGLVERERGTCSGRGEHFKEVRVEYNFDPIERVYREIAIVQDVSLWGRSRVYGLHSPLIRTEKRALKVAEAILANLNRRPELVLGQDVPNASEVVLSLDAPPDEFRRRLRQLAAEWEESGLSRLDPPLCVTAN